MPICASWVVSSIWRPAGDYLAECTVDVPDEVLTQTGALGVTVHGSDSNDNHIITARAFPLTVELEGDEEGEAPQPNP